MNKFHGDLMYQILNKHYHGFLNLDMVFKFYVS